MGPFPSRWWQTVEGTLKNNEKTERDESGDSASTGFVAHEGQCHDYDHGAEVTDRRQRVCLQRWKAKGFDYQREIES